MEIKVLCQCGQKYKFDVEPNGGKMPFSVKCPICGVDGTGNADTVLAQTLQRSSVPVAAGAAPMRLHQPTAGPVDAPGIPVAPPIPVMPRMVGVQSPGKKAASESNMALGIAGALLGAIVGTAAMYGFFRLTGIRFPLLGIGIGCLTGLGARWLYRGTDSSLGMVSGAIALLSVVGTLFLMYGSFPLISIISVAVSVSVAYRISS